MTRFLELVVQGSALGARYALVALGFVVIYRATGVINFAQGGFLALGAYLAFNFHQTWGWPFLPAVVAAMLCGALLGVVLELVVLRRLAGRPTYAVIMVTIGLLIVIDQVIVAVWGADPLSLGDPWGLRTVDLGDLSVRVVDLWTMAIALAVLVGFFLWFRFTRMGLAMRATALDREAALAQGMSSRVVYSASWAVAAAVAALAGVMLSGGGTGVSPELGLLALYALPVIVLGGLDSPPGAVVGGLVIGIAQVLTAGYQPEYAPWLGTGFNLVMPYLVMVVVLLVRPYGLFGTRDVRRI